MHFLFNLTTFLVLIMISGKLLIASQGDVVVLSAVDLFMLQDTRCLPAKRNLKSLPHINNAALKKYKKIQEIEEAKHVLTSIKSITAYTDEFGNIRGNTWILLDVDSTLTRPGNPLLSREVRIKFQALYTEMLRGLNPIQKRVFEHFQVMCEPRKLVEKVFPDVIEAMQQKKGKVFAFTSATMASLSSEAGNFSDWRYQELKNFGIDFTEAYSFKIFFKQEGLDHTGIDRGIIYCGFDEDKTHTLPAVFKTLKSVPENVIFIDDKEKNIELVSKLLKQHYPLVTFLGITYTAMDNFSEQTSYEIEESDFIKMMNGLIERTKQSCPDSNFTPLALDLKFQSQPQERVRHGKKSV